MRIGLSSPAVAALLLFVGSARATAQASLVATSDSTHGRSSSAPAMPTSAASARPAGDRPADIVGTWAGSDSMDPRSNNFILELRADGRYRVSKFASLELRDRSELGASGLEQGTWEVRTTTDDAGFHLADFCVSPSEGHFLPAACFHLVQGKAEMYWTGTGQQEGRPMLSFTRRGGS